MYTKVSFILGGKFYPFPLSAQITHKTDGLLLNYIFTKDHVANGNSKQMRPRKNPVITCFFIIPRNTW